MSFGPDKKHSLRLGSSLWWELLLLMDWNQIEQMLKAENMGGEALLGLDSAVVLAAMSL